MALRCLCFFLLWHMTLNSPGTDDYQLYRSQILWPETIEHGTLTEHAPVDPRAEDGSTAASRARLRAKHSGKDADAKPPNGGKLTWTRKRAFRRACHRATHGGLGGTVYRGRWMTTEALTGPTTIHTADGSRARPAAPQASDTGRALPSLRVQTHHVGGMSSDLYDTLCQWLRSGPAVDVLLLQEVLPGFWRKPLGKFLAGSS